MTFQRSCFVAGHDRLVVTVSEQEPSLTHLSAGFAGPHQTRTGGLPRLVQRPFVHRAVSNADGSERPLNSSVEGIPY